MDHQLLNRSRPLPDPVEQPPPRPAPPLTVGTVLSRLTLARRKIADRIAEAVAGGRIREDAAALALAVVDGLIGEVRGDVARAREAAKPEPTPESREAARRSRREWARKKAAGGKPAAGEGSDDDNAK